MGKRSSRRSRKARKAAAVAAEANDTSSSVHPQKDQLPCPVQVSWWNRGGQTHNDRLPPALTVQELQNETVPHSNVHTEEWQSLKALWEKLCKILSTSDPTDIQLHSWSLLLASKQNSLIQIAPTGSGKTFAYGLPLLAAAITANATDKKKQNKALVLVPTRELALQVKKECQRLVSGSSSDTAQVRVLALYGGVSKIEQQAQLTASRKCSIIVAATPGRLCDLMENEGNHWLAEEVKTIVLDEADRLAVQSDLRNQVEPILARCQPIDRIVLCSATWDPAATETWKEWMSNRKVAVVKLDALSIVSRPNERSKDQEQSESGGDAAKFNSSQPDNDTDAALCRIPGHVKQTVHVCSQHKKPKKILITLTKIYKEHETGGRNKPLGIVFFAKITTLQYIAKLLRKDTTHRVVELHSQMPQTNRESAVESFRAGKCPLLLATDICARGLHVPNVRFVVHYDFPGNLQDYVHRCGRAGRGATTPVHVYSFFTRPMAALAPDLVKLLESTGQWIDPNLTALVEDASRRASRKKEQKKRNTLQAGNDKETSKEANAGRFR